MSDDLQWAREVVEAATPGPWVREYPDDPDSWLVSAHPEFEGCADRDVCRAPRTEDTKAIALLGSVGRELLAVAEAADRVAVDRPRVLATLDLRQALDALRKALAAARGEQ